MAQVHHSSSPLLAWIDHALRADRHAVDLALALRHVALLKELAPHLEGLEWSATPSAKLQLEFAAAAAVKSSDVGASYPKRFSSEQPLQGLRDLPAPHSPSSICSLELQENNEQDPVLLAQDLQDVQFLQQEPQQLTVSSTDEEQDITTSSATEKGLRVLKQVEQVVHNQPSMKSVTTHDTDTEEEWNTTSRIRQQLKQLLKDQRFETLVGCVIIANSLCMGMETSWEIQGRDSTPFQILEHFFLAVYVFELSLHFGVYGCSCLKNSWVLFDFILVSTGALSNYVVGPIMSSIHANNSESMKDGMSGILIMRMLRLFRLARAIRFLVIFKTLWLLVSGLMHSAGTIAYTFSLILLILYVFSCMALELITKRLQHDHIPIEVQTIVQTQFPDLMITMLTLMQFVSMDSIASIYFPLITYDPFLVIFFIPFILIVSICLMNLVTAVIVEGAIEQGNQDKEAQSRYKQHKFNKMLPGLKAMFRELDKDGNGTVTMQELQQAPEKLRQKLEQVMKADSLAELFEMVDVDESGECDIDEFCDGVAKLINSDTPVESLRILKQLALLRRNIRELHTAIRQMGHLSLPKPT